MPILNRSMPEHDFQNRRNVMRWLDIHWPALLGPINREHNLAPVAGDGHRLRKRQPPAADLRDGERLGADVKTNPHIGGMSPLPAVGDGLSRPALSVPGLHAIILQ